MPKKGKQPPECDSKTSKKQKVEDLVLSIVEVVRQAADNKEAQNKVLLHCIMLDKLEKKKRETYYKVTQALSEIGIEDVIKMFQDHYSNSVNMRLLVHCMNNTAAIRRVLAHRSSLFRCIKMHLYFYLQANKPIEEFTWKPLQILYRCILMDRPQGLSRQLLFDDNIEEVLHHLETKVCLFSPWVVQTVEYIARIYNALYDLGDDMCRKKIDKLVVEGKTHLPAMHKMMKKSGVKAHNFYVFMEVFEKKLREKSPCFVFRLQLKFVRLAQTELHDEYHVFCSSPSCRKMKGADKELQHCRRCMLARYCDKTCQKNHWKDGHKEQCRPLDGGLVRP